MTLIQLGCLLMCGCTCYPLRAMQLRGDMLKDCLTPSSAHADQTWIVLTYSSGNSSAGVTADPSWQPLLTTVPEPDYPSGHGVLSGVAEAVLRK